jgi:hypothetical protein
MPEHIVIYGDSLKIPEDDHIGKTPMLMTIPRKDLIVIKKQNAV